MLEIAFARGSFEIFVENLTNDLEVGVVRMQPRLAQIKEELTSHGAAVVSLTGSGSALFAVFSSQGAVETLIEGGLELEDARLLACSPVDHGARVVSRNGRRSG